MGVNMGIPNLEASSGYDNVIGCSIFVAKHKISEDSNVGKVILLNALVPYTDDVSIMLVIPITVEEAKKLIERATVIESFIGHESTAKLLSQLFEREIQTNRGMYKPKDNDLAIVVRLKKRLEKPEDVKNITTNDIELLLVRYYTNVHIVEFK